MKIAGKTYMSIFKSPLGDMFLTSDGESLISVRFDFQKKPVYEYVAERKESLKIFRLTKNGCAPTLRAKTFLFRRWHYCLTERLFGAMYGVWYAQFRSAG